MKNLFILLFFALPCSFAVSQEPSRTLSGKELRKSGPKYIGITAGIGRSAFRDFATSPLFYSGYPVTFQLSFLKENPRRERQLNLRYTFGKYVSRGVEYPNSSSAQSFFIDYLKLYRLNKISNLKWNYKAGGMIAFTSNIRQNPSLQNNTVGLEFFGNLMGVFQVTRDLSRTEENPKKFLFIPYGRKLKDRSIGFRLQAGLVNANYHNGFIYTQQYQLVNQFEFFENYEFKLSGLRFGSSLFFTRNLPNGNAFRFAYNWDAYRSSYRFEGFDMAHHTLSFSLLFRTK